MKMLKYAFEIDGNKWEENMMGSFATLKEAKEFLVEHKETLLDPFTHYEAQEEIKDYKVVINEEGTQLEETYNHKDGTTSSSKTVIVEITNKEVK